jgi:hypothetical protein
MIRDINLIEYLPLFIQDYREIGQIMNAENPEFQLLADESERLKNNQFIETSNLNGIARFEKLLKIIPSVDDTLESRISRVLTRWNDVIPYTYKAFIQKMMVLCDGINFTINNDFNVYKMEIITHLELSGQVDELQNLLGYIIPSNIEITSNNEIYCDSSTNLYVLAGMAACSIVEFSDSYKADFNIQGNSNIGGTYIGTAQVTLSDNYNETVTINGTGKTGSNASVVEISGIN